MVHEEYNDMLPAMALGALDTEDARAADAHLKTCVECQAFLSEWEDTAAALAFAALEEIPLEPSPRVRARILEAIRTGAAHEAPPEEGEQKRAETSNVIALHERRSRWSAAQTWGAIAAGLVLLTLLASLFALWEENKRTKQELARLSNEVRDAEQQLNREREAIEIVATPGAHMAELVGTNVLPNAHATVAYDPSGRAVLLAKGLPAPPPGKAYQLWFIAGGKPLPGRVFITDASGAGTSNDHLPAQALAPAGFAITLEPESGVQSPTPPIYLSSKVS
jgi:hypothetical protein